MLKSKYDSSNLVCEVINIGQEILNGIRRILYRSYNNYAFDEIIVNKNTCLLSNNILRERFKKFVDTQKHNYVVFLATSIKLRFIMSLQ